MQSNIEEHGLTDTKRTYVERVVAFVLGGLGEAVLAVTDSRKFMIVMHAICFSVAAICILTAFRTGKYGTYFISAGTIAGLSCLWPRFTTRAMNKRRKGVDEQRKRE
jgi:Na+/proline symporter